MMINDIGTRWLWVIIGPATKASKAVWRRVGRWSRLTWVIRVVWGIAFLPSISFREAGYRLRTPTILETMSAPANGWARVGAASRSVCRADGYAISKWTSRTDSPHDGKDPAVKLDWCSTGGMSRGSS
jgi:hypothetical protein